MIIVKGEHYETDDNRSAFKKDFNDIDSLFRYLTDDLPYGKDTLQVPWLDADGSIKVPRSMSACIRFKVADRRYPVDECVFLIEENGKILFSDGTLTGGQAHIGKRAKDLLDKLDAFKKSEYAFGD